MLVRNSPNFITLARRAIQVRQDNQLHIRVNFEGLLQGFRAHVPAVRLRIDKHGFAALVGHRVHGGVKGTVGAKHLMPLQRSDVHGLPPVQPFSGQADRQVQGSGTGTQAHCVLPADFLRAFLFHQVNVFTDGGNPVGQDGFVHPALLIAVHGGAGQPAAGLKGRNPPEPRVVSVICHNPILRRS